MLKAAIPSVVLYAPYTHNPTRFQHDYPKMKTKIVLRNIYYSPLAGVCLFVTTLKMLTSPPVLKLLDWIPSILVSFLPNYCHYK